MPFGAASITRVIKEQIEQTNWVTGPTELTAFLTTGLSRVVNMPDADKIKYISVDGEVLETVRALALTAGSVLEVAVATAEIASHIVYFPIAGAVGLLAGPWALAVSLEGQESVLDPIATGLGSVNLHSQSFLALLQYAKDNHYTDWQTIAKPLLTGWFDADDTIAKPLGLTNDQMLRQIVYTALDSGETPFGTAAIKALFDDANELGYFYSLSNLSGNLADAAIKSDLTKIITQFSGNLAVNKVSDVVSAVGVFDYDPDFNIISLDLRKSSWDFGASAESIMKFVAEKKTLVEKLTMGFLNVSELEKIDLIVSAAQNSDALVTSLFDINSTDSALFLSDGLNDSVIGTTGDDYIYCYDAGNDIVDGAGGINTAIYKGLISDYTAVKTFAGLSITELLSGTHQTDALKNIQQIKFADQEFVVDQFQPLMAMSSIQNMVLDVVDIPADLMMPAVQKGITVIYDLNSDWTHCISGLYEICFDRLPDVDGIRYWEADVESLGNNQQALLQIAKSFLASNEYGFMHPDLNNE